MHYAIQDFVCTDWKLHPVMNLNLPSSCIFKDLPHILQLLYSLVSYIFSLKDLNLDCVLPVLIYGVETWTLMAKTINKIRVATV